MIEVGEKKKRGEENGILSHETQNEWMASQEEAEMIIN